MKMNPFSAGACGVEQAIGGTIKFNSAGGEVALGTLPPGAIVTKTIANVKVVFNAATTNVLTVGTDAGRTNLAGAADIDEAAVALTRVEKAIAVAAATPVYAKYAQTGTAATTGEADILVFFVRTPQNLG